MQRRAFLAAAGAAAVAACTSGTRRPARPAPSTVASRAAPATTLAPRGPGIRAVEHVVIVIQENRSFDHYFGTYRGVRGFGDPSAQLAQTDGRGGVRLPFHLTNGCTSDAGHGWATQHEAWNNGRMDRWAVAHVGDPVAFGYYQRADLTWYYALADAFTICDGYHCSVLGPTDPNRLMSLTGTIDADGTAGGPVIADGRGGPLGSHTDWRWTTMPERLSAHGVSWKVYQSPATLTDTSRSNNVLVHFPQYMQGDLYQRAFSPSYPDGWLADVAAGALPDVAWILVPPARDEHPPVAPALGESALQQVLSSLVDAPDTWAKTVLFVTWDENGGFFDHVAPPVPPRDAPGEWVAGEPVGLGFRVPMLVASPFSRGGWVCSDAFDHTSILRFLEARFGVEVPNLSAWRRSATGDLTATLDFAHPDTSVPAALLGPPLGDMARAASGCLPYAAAVERGDPLPFTPAVATTTPPRQEPGSAPRRAGTPPVA